MLLRSLLVSFLFSVFAVSLFARAEKETWAYGVGINGGYLSDKNFIATEDKSVGGGIDGFVGYSFSDEFTILAYAHYMLGSNKFGGESFYTLISFWGILAQYNFLDRFYFRIGPGVASTYAKVTVNGTTYERDRTGAAAILAPGIELYQSGNFAIDLHAKLFPQWYQSDEQGFALGFGGGLGVIWY